MTIIWLLVGLGLIVLGADWLVEGASSIARRAGVSEFVIGLTIVGFGTSCPELVVSLTGAFEGNADIAVGNVIGSNIFNVLFILGLTALLCPVSMTRDNRKKDIPLTLVITILFLAALIFFLFEPFNNEKTYLINFFRARSSVLRARIGAVSHLPAQRLFLNPF